MKGWRRCLGCKAPIYGAQSVRLCAACGGQRDGYGCAGVALALALVACGADFGAFGGAGAGGELGGGASSSSSASAGGELALGGAGGEFALGGAGGAGGELALGGAGGALGACATDVAACGHSVCAEGPPMSPICDRCVAAVCALEPSCCAAWWAAACVAAAPSACACEC